MEAYILLACILVLGISSCIGQENLISGEAAKFCPESGNAEEDLFTSENRCYQLIERRESMVTYDAASNDCRSRGAYLMRVDNSTAKDFLNTELPKVSDSHTVLLGLRKRSGVWKWDNGAALSYTNWDPQDSFDGDCAKMLLDKGSIWEKADCGAADWFSVYVCEHDSTSTSRSSVAHPIIYTLLLWIALSVSTLLTCFIH